MDIEIQLRMNSLASTAKYIESNMVDVPMFQSKKEVLDLSLSKVSLDGMYCEFGVYKGSTANHIARVTKKPIHAFDSFEGLPEDWSIRHKKGLFALKNMPTFEDNVVVHKGWFDDTLPGFAQEEKGDLAFLHIDSDLYSSAKTIFQYLGDRIIPGTIILFDEYFNYPFWEHHEYKAFAEFVAENNIKYEYLGFNTLTYGSNAAVKIISRD